MSNRYSFTSIFEEEIPYVANESSTEETKVVVSEIVIPRIQRPYAQGRKLDKETKVRKDFLKDLFQSLENGSDLDLTFVYGTVIKIGDNKYQMQLLDGQQRFTTLFLLYWYIINKEKVEDTDKVERVKKALKNFKYETRNSSTAFCEYLSEFEANMDNDTPKKCIQNSTWYLRVYERDSTIQGMLTMLNDIDKKYKEGNCSQLFGNLDKIQFSVLSLPEFRQTEDLYIKLNERGKELTNFDNFKSEYLGTCASFEEAGKTVLYQGANVDYLFRFSNKLDTVWTNLFWSIENKDSYAHHYLQFFSRYFATKYILDHTPTNLKEWSNKEMHASLYDFLEEKEYLGFDSYKKELEEHHKYLYELEILLDVFVNHKEDIYKELSPSWNKGDNLNILDKESFTQTDRVVLACVIEFILLQNRENSENLDFRAGVYKAWMRIVWNVVENKDIDNIINAASAIKELVGLLREVFLTQINTDCEFYEKFSGLEGHSDQVKEEIEKAKRIVENINWLSAFQEAEKHPFFKGRVSIFYTEQMELETFKKRCKKIFTMFNEKGITNEYRQDHVLIRAIVAQLDKWAWNYQGIDRLYVTEDSESHKYLKLLLSNNKQVQKMLNRVLDSENDSISLLKEETLKQMPIEDEDGNTLKGWEYQVNRSLNRLRSDIKLWDWISNGKLKVIRSYYSQIAVAPPSSWYDRVLLDTDREQLFKQMWEETGFLYNDNEYNGSDTLFVGNRLTLLGKVTGDYTLSVGFEEERRFVIKVISASKRKLLALGLPEEKIFPENNISACVVYTDWYKAMDGYEGLYDKVRYFIECLKKPSQDQCIKIEEKHKEVEVERKSFKFSMVGLSEGEFVVFDEKGLRCKIIGLDRIEYNGETYSLSGFTKKFSDKNWESYRGPDFFSYKGKTLTTLRMEKSSAESEES